MLTRACEQRDLKYVCMCVFVPVLYLEHCHSAYTRLCSPLECRDVCVCVLSYALASSHILKACALVCVCLFSSP